MILPVWGFWLAALLAVTMLTSAIAALVLCGRALVGSVFALFWGGLGGLLLIALCQAVAA
ncbi:hypothetical protein [Aureimonas sp. D3]|uniref:hypothetical protein n=1 Tax=Aureimonas sp. D3 TaxID=1638164 RepID=UPI0007805755|nr:hypothetical protein [Aureimonas sp. D3]